MIELSKEALEYKAMYEAAMEALETGEQVKKLKRKFEENNMGNLKAVHAGLVEAQDNTDIPTRRAIVNFNNLIRTLEFDGYIAKGVIAPIKKEDLNEKG